MVLFWLLLSLFFFLVELSSPGLFYFLSFASGSLVSFFLSLKDYTPFEQISWFFVSSLLSFLLLKLLASYIIRRGATHRTNTEALIGQRGLVVKKIDAANFGQVRINSQVWSARSIDRCPLLVETTIEVEAVVGCHLVVKKVSVVNDRCE